MQEEIRKYIVKELQRKSPSTGVHLEFTFGFSRAIEFIKAMELPNLEPKKKLEEFAELKVCSTPEPSRRQMALEFARDILGQWLKNEANGSTPETHEYQRHGKIAIEAVGLADALEARLDEPIKTPEKRDPLIDHPVWEIPEVRKFCQGHRARIEWMDAEKAGLSRDDGALMIAYYSGLPTRVYNENWIGFMDVWKIGMWYHRKNYSA